MKIHQSTQPMSAHEPSPLEQPATVQVPETVENEQDEKTDAFIGSTQCCGCGRGCNSALPAPDFLKES